MLEDVFSLIQWWGMLFVLGIVVFPLTYTLFPRFLDRGYGLSKTLAIGLLSYAVFLFGTLHLIPFTILGLFLTFFLTFGIVLVLLFTKFKFPLHKEFLPFLKKQWLILAIEELLFLIVLFFWSYVRAHEPTINGLEKFMDYGFINSVLRSEYFPAKDMWFTPLAINYYYFGHLVTAVLTKLSFLPSNITYNLMVATLAALCFVSSFSVGATLLSLERNLTGKLKYLLVGGLLAALLTTFSGNLHTIYTFFEAYPNENPVPVWELVFSPNTFPNNYWYPNATRFIYNTIHEFPIYSWVVSDLHGHVLDIPFVLLTIAFLLSFFLRFYLTDNPFLLPLTSTKSHRKASWSIQRLNLPFISHLLFISFLVAILYMTNAWDGIIYLLLTGLLLLYLFRQIMPKASRRTFWSHLADLFLRLVASGLILGIGFVLFSLPFSLFFKPFVSGIGILCAPEFLTSIGSFGPFLFETDHCQRSPLWQLFILHGFFYLFVTAFLIFLGRSKKIFSSDLFVLFLILLSTLLIAIPEFAYMKDIYPAHYRANTMFKLVFQSFIMLSFATGYIIIRLSQAFKEQTKNRYLYPLFVILVTPLLFLVFSYPYFAIMSYYGELSTYHGLNGTAYLEDKYPSDAKALTWLQENISGQPVILEAQGDSYTDYGRISANTGLPTVLGWTVHEWLWRGTYDIPAPRIEEIKSMYESPNLQQTKDLLQKYNVEYVILGELEHEQYLELNERKFEDLGEVVFQDGETKIIQLDK